MALRISARDTAVGAGMSLQRTHISPLFFTRLLERTSHLSGFRKEVYGVIRYNVLQPKR